MTTQAQRQPDTQTTQSTTTKTRRWLRRMRQSPLAITGVVIIAVFLFVVIFAPFLAPYSPTTQNLRTTYIPPGTGVHWGGPNGEFGIFVSPVTRSPIGGVSVDDSERFPVQWLVRGEDSWTWAFGLISSNWHLFGVDGPVRFHLLGTDEQGREAWRVSAPAARHFEASDLWQLDSPTWLIQTGQGAPWHGQADQARSWDDEQQVRLTGDVRLRQSHPEGDTVMTTEWVDMRLPERYIETTAPVSLITSSYEVDALGARGWLTEERFELTANARGRYEAND